MLHAKVGAIAVLAALTLSAQAGINQWTFGGPDGGEAVLVAISPFDSSLQLAGAEGALFKLDTTTGRWVRVSSLPEYSTVVRFDPSDPGIVLLSTSGEGFSRSTDGGETFTRANPAAVGFSGVEQMDAGADGVAYAEYYWRGVWRTSDAGATWSEVRNGLPPNDSVPSLYAPTTDLAVAPSRSERVYLIYRTKGVYVTDDSGATWTQAAATGLPLDIGSLQASLFVDPLDADHFWLAGTSSFETFDGGATFSVSSVGVSRGLRAVMGVPGSLISLPGFGGAFQRSDDSGQTWGVIDDGGLAFRDVVINADGSALGATYQSVVRRPDATGAWSRAVEGFSATRRTAFETDALNDRLFLAVDNDGLWMSADQGQTFEFRAGGADDVGGLALSDTLDLLVVDDPVSRLFAVGSFTGSVFASSDAGVSWVEQSALPLFNPVYNYRITSAPSDPQRLYLTTLFGLRNIYVSDDQGLTWTQRDFSLVVDNAIANIVGPAVDPNDANTLVMATRLHNDNRIWRSQDAGVTWAMIEQNFDAVYDLAFSVNVENRVYAGTNLGFFVSADGGDSFALMAPGVFDSTLDLIEYPGVPGVLVGSSLNRGVKRSLDDGLTWEDIDEAAPNARTRDFFASDFLRADPHRPELLYGGSYTVPGFGRYTLSRDTAVSPDSGLTTDLATPVTVSVLVTNAGPGNAGQVKTSLGLSERGRIIEVQTASGVCDFDDGQASCTINQLADGATDVIAVTIKPVWLGEITLTAAVESLEQDPATQNNQSEVTAVIVLDVDVDGDGVVDSADNCALIANADQRDTNADGFGNMCDADLNDDGVINIVDLGILRSVFFSSNADADLNGDGVVSVIDLGLLRNQFFGAPGPSGVQPPVNGGARSAR